MLPALPVELWQRACGVSSEGAFMNLRVGIASKDLFRVLLAAQEAPSARERITYKTVVRANIDEHQEQYLGSPQGNLAAPVINGKNKIPVTTSKHVLAEPHSGKAYRWVWDHVAQACGTRHGAALQRLHLLVCDSDGKVNEAAALWLVDVVAEYVVDRAEADPIIGQRRRAALEKVASGAAQAASSTRLFIVTVGQPAREAEDSDSRSPSPRHRQGGYYADTHSRSSSRSRSRSRSPPPRRRQGAYYAGHP